MNESTPPKGEKVFAVIALLIITGALSGPLIPLMQRHFGLHLPKGHILSMSLILIIYFFTIVLLSLHRRKALSVIAQNKFFWLFVLLAVVSSSWSIMPYQSLTLSLALLLTALFGLYLAVRYSVAEQLRLLIAALGIAALLSFLLVVIFPLYGISGPPHEGCWRGIYIHKNVLGRYIFMGCLALVVSIKSGLYCGKTAYFALGFMLLIGIFSGSRLAEVAFMAALLLQPLHQLLQKGFRFLRKTVITGILLVCAGTVFLFIFKFGTLTSLLGRDITLTGRTGIWAEAIKLTVNHSWIGHGFGGFWPYFDDSSKLLFLGSKINAINGHNGFLDIWIDLGFLGLIIFLVVLILAFNRAIERFRSGSGPENLWPLIYLTFLVVINLGETEFLCINNIFWTMTTATILSLNSHTCDTSSATASNN
ncbi:MAG: O-antigen ligase family protein [Bacillota bacterium]